MSAGHRRPQILAKTNPPTGHQQMETVPAETVAEAAADLQLTVAWVLGPRRITTGPLVPFTGQSDATVPLAHCCHSYPAQHISRPEAF